MSKKAKIVFTLAVIILMVILLLLKWPPPVSGKETKEVTLEVPPSHLWIADYVRVRVVTEGGDLQLVLTNGGRWKDYVVIPYDPSIVSSGSLDTKLWVLRGKLKRAVTVDSSAKLCLKIQGIRITVPHSEVNSGGMVGFASEYLNKGRMLIVTSCEFDLIVKTSKGKAYFDEVRKGIDLAFSHLNSSLSIGDNSRG